MKLWFPSPPEGTISKVNKITYMIQTPIQDATDSHQGSTQRMIELKGHIQKIAEDIIKSFAGDESGECYWLFTELDTFGMNDKLPEVAGVPFQIGDLAERYRLIVYVRQQAAGIAKLRHFSA